MPLARRARIRPVAPVAPEAAEKPASGEEGAVRLAIAKDGLDCIWQMRPPMWRIDDDLVVPPTRHEHVGELTRPVRLSVAPRIGSIATEGIVAATVG